MTALDIKFGIPEKLTDSVQRPMSEAEPRGIQEDLSGCQQEC